MMMCGSVASILSLLNLAPIECLFEENLGGLNGSSGVQDAVTHPEEHQSEENASEGVGVDPLSNASVLTVYTFSRNFSWGYTELVLLACTHYSG